MKYDIDSLKQVFRGAVLFNVRRIFKNPLQGSLGHVFRLVLHFLHYFNNELAKILVEIQPGYIYQSKNFKIYIITLFVTVVSHFNISVLLNSPPLLTSYFNLMGPTDAAIPTHSSRFNWSQSVHHSKVMKQHTPERSNKAILCVEVWKIPS